VTPERGFPPPSRVEEQEACFDLMGQTGSCGRISAETSSASNDLWSKVVHEEEKG